MLTFISSVCVLFGSIFPTSLSEEVRVGRGELPVASNLGMQSALCVDFSQEV